MVWFDDMEARRPTCLFLIPLGFFSLNIVVRRAKNVCPVRDVSLPGIHLSR